MYDDNPTVRDLLGYGSLAQSLGKQINGCKPPYVFGVHGDWGGGKTSFLLQLATHLKGELPVSY